MSKNSIFRFFLAHKVAANLLMIFMVILGVYGIQKLNVQFLANFKLNYVTINVPWIGASASDVERSIIVPVEKKLKGIDELKEIFSKADYGAGVIILEFNENADMSQAYQDVQQRMSTVTNLPGDIEKPIITKIERYEPVGRIVLSGTDSLNSIRQLAYEYEKELLSLGIAKINLIGMPIQELSVEVPPNKLKAMGMTLPEIAELVNNHSKDASLGTAGKNDTAKELRMVKAIRDIQSLAGVPIANINTAQVTTLGDIATIRFKNREGQSLYFENGKPAIELQLLRTQNEDSLKVAKIMRDWFEKTKTAADAEGVHLKIYDEQWLLIKQRIMLLIKNGLTGLIFIVIMLGIFLDKRVAFWVAVSIPVSCLAALYFLHLFGGSINMVSLFAIIMVLGIIVDDSIVVGENAYHEFRQGASPFDAAKASIKRMFIPVLGSSLTTIAAFIPLMLIKGITGQILFSIPLVVICVILASLIECFLVLPYHLKNSFLKINDGRKSKFRIKFDEFFSHFRDHYFQSVLIYALKHRWSVIVISAASLLVALGLLIGSHVPFTYFNVPDANNIKLNVTFIPGTKTETVKSFLLEARSKIENISSELKKKYPNEPTLVKMITEHLSKTADLRRDQQFETGENVGHLNVELSEPDDRSLSNNQIIEKWTQTLENTAGIIKLVISSPKGGPPGRDIDISLRAKTPEALKKAALYVQSELKSYAGVINVSDNLPGGREQWLLSLKPSAIRQGMTVRDIAAQVNAAFSRRVAQRITDGQDEIDLVVTTPDKYKYNLLTVLDFPIKLKNNQMVRLDSLVNIKPIKGFNRLIHQDMSLSVNVTADVDNTITNANEVLTSLQNNVLGKLKNEYGVNYQLKGKAEEQAETFTEMKTGLIIGVVLIYIILALIFSSYTWPILVMLVIPFGIFGAIIGHLVMGYDMTILSLFGLFGLAGILMNDSIILVNTYKEIREKGKNVFDSLTQATVLRLRPVLLTSLTTIVGLIPILFETSRQAKFLIPMVISIVFGLMFTTLIILLVLPCIFAIVEKIEI